MIDIKTNISVTISDDEDYGTTYEILANKDDLNKLIDVILSLGNKKEAVLVKETNLKDDSKTLIIQRNDALDCGVGEGSWETLGQQDQISQS